MISNLRSACCWLLGIIMGAAFMADAYWVLLVAALLVIPYRHCGEALALMAEEYVRRKHAFENPTMGILVREPRHDRPNA